MARKRKRSVYQSARRRVRSFTAGRSGPADMKEILFSAGYGYFRRDIVDFAKPLINMIPAGDYSDNVALGLGAYAVSYLLKPTDPNIKAALRTVVLNESFVAGSKMRAGASFTTTTTASASSSSSEYL